MKRLKKSKMRTVLLKIVLVSFIIWNIVWVLNYSSYLKYTDGYEKQKVSMVKKIGTYNYTVKSPRYLSFTGNFAINNGLISCIIWPNLFISGKYEYGLRIYDNEIDHGYMFYVDEKLNYLNIPKNDFSDEELKIIDNILKKNKKELGKIRRLAIKEWHLVSEKSE